MHTFSHEINKIFFIFQLNDYVIIRVKKQKEMKLCFSYLPEKSHFGSLLKIYIYQVTSLEMLSELYKPRSWAEFGGFEKRFCEQ